VTEPIAIPTPALVVLIGAAGAGKTTLAARLFEPTEILSSDALREAVSGDPADQRANRPTFRILHREVGRRLAAGRLVVVDATNVEPGARAALLGLARAAGTAAIAIAIVAPAAEVHRRNAARAGRVVPSAVVDRHLGRLDELGGDPAEIAARLLADGFAAVHVVSTVGELDRVRVVRGVAVSRPVAPSLPRSARSRRRP
jgi:predicted kinase